MPDDARVLLGHAGHEAGHVHQRQDRHVVTVAGPDEAGGFVAGIDVERTGHEFGIVAHHAHHPPAQVREAADDVSGPVGLNLEKRAVIDHVLDDAVHVVGPPLIGGDDAQQLGVGAV